jgi:hypothetical protein
VKIIDTILTLVAIDVINLILHIWLFIVGMVRVERSFLVTEVFALFVLSFLGNYLSLSFYF